MIPPFAEALAYRSPRVEARLVEQEIADTAAEGAQLFDELKRFLVLSHTHPDGWPMHSFRIDAAWHEFVLFTDEYARYCARHFGVFMTHDPTPPAAPDADEPLATAAAAAESPHASYADFCAAYASLFGEPPPPIWDDAAAVGAHRRLRNPRAGTLSVRPAGAKVELVTAEGGALVRVDAWAEPALRFVARHRTFYVRELPGPLQDRDRVALCDALVRSGALKPCW